MVPQSSGQPVPMQQSAMAQSGTGQAIAMQYQQPAMVQSGVNVQPTTTSVYNEEYSNDATKTPNAPPDYPSNWKRKPSH